MSLMRSTFLWTYSRSHFAIGSRAARTASHTLQIERSEVKGGFYVRMKLVKLLTIMQNTGLLESHLSSGQARLTSAASLTRGTFRSTNTGGTTLTSGSLRYKETHVG